MEGTRHHPAGQKSWILALNPCYFQIRKTKMKQTYQCSVIWPPYKSWWLPVHQPKLHRHSLVSPVLSSMPSSSLSQVKPSPDSLPGALGSSTKICCVPAQAGTNSDYTNSSKFVCVRCVITQGDTVHALFNAAELRTTLLCCRWSSLSAFNKLS